MFVDASALVAILLEEPDYPLFAAALERSNRSVVTHFVLMETGLAALRENKHGADFVHAGVHALLRQFDIQTVDMTSAMILTALQAYARYGKGREHPARLNMGDCLSYGAARTLNVPLLYKGEDFARTDIAPALPR
jgi:ribonuclease VapC